MADILKSGTRDDALRLSRDVINEIKRKAVPQNGNALGCPSIVNKIGTKIRLKQNKDGSIEIGCEGIKDSEICPQCPIYVTRERA